MGGCFAVDILMPVRNAELTIRSAVESIRRQTIDVWPLVAIDDGSTDATHSVLASLAEQDDRILVLRGPRQGVASALKLGLGHCCAALVARQDADDIAYPDRLRRQSAALAADPGLVAVGCYLRHVDEGGLPTGTWARFRPPEGSDPGSVPAFEPV